jgi:hypothetical protein
LEWSVVWRTSQLLRAVLHGSGLLARRNSQ